MSVTHGQPEQRALPARRRRQDVGRRGDAAAAVGADFSMKIDVFVIFE